MSLFVLFVSFIAVAIAQSYSQAAPNTTAPVVNLGYVSYAGYTNSTIGINYYRGIPYAQSPTGALRWQKPRPIETNNNFTGQLLNATQIAPSCFQSLPEPLLGNVPLGDVSQQSEDCLILDVLTPINPASGAIPILVQIHGGGYTAGNAQTEPGDNLVNISNGNLIYMSMQYRLGLFGFLGGSEIAENGALNAGLLDQRAALQWIQRHASAFGGDPSRVTIWGGSAGGGSVTYQLIAGGAVDDPPFSAAIAEYPWWQPLLNSSTQSIQYRSVLSLSGCSDLNCLRSLSMEELGPVGQEAQNASFPSSVNGYGSFWFGPVVDGKFIRDLPDQEFKAGNFHKVPLITDHDQYEGVVFTDPTLMTQVQETTDAQDLFPYAGPSFFSRLYQLYPAPAFNSTFFQRQTWFGDFIISCPTYQLATAFTDHSTNSSAVFKLIFAAGSQLHAATAPFLAGTTTDYPYANNRTLAEIMTSYWISFAVSRTHDPNELRSDKAPFWRSYRDGGEGDVANGESVGFSVLDVTYADIQNVVDPDAGARCDFFSSQGAVLRN